MKEHLTEKFLVGIVADIAVSISKATAITFVCAIYGVEASIQWALAAAFSFSVLSIRFKKGGEVPTWGDALNSSVFLCVMPWAFVLTAWLASFVV